MLSWRYNAPRGKETTLCGGPGGISAWGAGQTVELRLVHRLSDGNPETIPSCHHIPRNLTEDQEEA